MQTSPRARSIRRRFALIACGREVRGEAGFTMMELLVVLGILALLAGLAIVNVNGIFGGAQTQTAQIFVRETLKTPLFSYNLRMGGYPTTAEGLNALITPPADKADRWGTTPYLTEPKIPVDPWGEPYQYENPGKHNKSGVVPYDLWSKGPDKVSGTDDDIGNWDSTSATAAPK